jgi:hypothetical protein
LENNIKIDLKEIGCASMNWISSGYWPVVGSCEYADEPTISIKY